MFLLLLWGGIESIWGCLQVLLGDSNSLTFLLSGSFQNPGQYSICPMLGCISGFTILKNRLFEESGMNYQQNEKNNHLRYFVIEMLIVNLIILPATLSRTAWLVLSIWALWFFKNSYWKWRWLLWITLAILFVCLYFLKQASADNRIFIAITALTTLKHNLWTGVGVGGFLNACSEGISELYSTQPEIREQFQSLGIIETSFNVFVTILVEQGIIGALLCLICVCLFAYHLYRSVQVVFPCFISLIIFSCFSYPFDALPCRIILIVITVFAASKVTRNKTLITNKSKTFLIVFALIITLSSCSLRNEIRRRWNCDQKWFSLFTNQASYSIIDYWNILDEQIDNPLFLLDMAKKLEEKGLYQDSNAILRMGQRVSCNPCFYWMEGNNWQKMGFASSAETAYLKSFSVLPNRMYPLYKLMLLYKETYQQEKALQIAKRIIEITPRIKSPATDEMQEKAREILVESGN